MAVSALFLFKVLATLPSLSQSQSKHGCGACRLYGCNVCGEGGEYETLVLDCPLFQHACIQLDASEVQHMLAGSLGAVAILHPTQYHLALKRLSNSAAAKVSEQTNGHEDSRNSEQASVSGPSTSSGDNVIWVPSDFDAQLPMLSHSEREDAVSSEVEVAVQASASGVHISCTPRTPSSDSTQTAAQRVQQALHGALDAIQRGNTSYRMLFYIAKLKIVKGEELTNRCYAALDPHGLSLASALFVHLYLARMEDFGAANMAYGQHFPAVSPPARACVQAQLPPGLDVTVDILFAQGAPSP